MRSLLGFSFAFAIVVGALGCGGSEKSNKVSLKGKLVDGGKDFVLDKSKLKLPAGATGLPPGARLISISFIPVDGGETAPATVDDATGAFTVNLAPGTYKVTIGAGAGMNSPDYFGGKFSPEKSQIKREIKAGEDIVIDVSKPQG